MKTKALQQAKARLKRARTAVSDMGKASQFSALDESWSNFLVASKLVLTKLGAGAKGDPRSEGWFAGKLGEQRSDSLLSFLYQARNVEEHGLDRSLEHAYDVRVVPGVFLEVEAIFEPNGDVTFRNAQSPHEVIHFTLKATLKAVVDTRSGRTFGPPLEHLGRSLKDTSAFGVAETNITYLEGVIAEATQLPQRT